MKTITDPVCEKQLLPWWSAVRGLYDDVQGKRYYFCSRDCLQKFQAHPAAYMMLEDQSRADDDGMQQPQDFYTDWT